jgi:hypothetical protein
LPLSDTHDPTSVINFQGLGSSSVQGLGFLRLHLAGIGLAPECKLHLPSIRLLLDVVYAAFALERVCNVRQAANSVFLSVGFTAPSIIIIIVIIIIVIIIIVIIIIVIIIIVIVIIVIIVIIIIIIKSMHSRGPRLLPRKHTVTRTNLTPAYIPTNQTPPRACSQERA